MYLHRLVTLGMGFVLISGLSLAQSPQDEEYLTAAIQATIIWHEYKDPEQLRLAYTKWEMAIRKDTYLRRSDVDKTKPSPTWQGFRTFCKEEYRHLLKYDQRAGLRCAKLVGETKEAQYWLERQRRESQEILAQEAMEHQAKAWLDTMIEQIEDQGCGPAIDHYEAYYLKLGEVTPQSSKRIYKEAQEILAQCEAVLERRSAEITKATRDYQTMMDLGLLQDAADKAMALDCVIQGIEPTNFIQLCLLAKTADGNAQINAQRELREAKAAGRLGSCAEPVAQAEIFRDFCLKNMDRIAMQSRILQEQCLFIVGAKDRSKQINKIQTLQQKSFYFETDFAKPAKSNLDMFHVSADAIRMDLMSMVEAYGGRMSKSPSYYVKVSVRVSKGRGGIMKRKVALEARLGHRRGKHIWSDSRVIDEDEGTDLATATAKTRFYSQVLFSAFMAHLTRGDLQ